MTHAIDQLDRIHAMLTNDAIDRGLIALAVTEVANALRADETTHVLIERGRWERVREWAAAVWGVRITMSNDTASFSEMRRVTAAHKALQPGDMDEARQ